MPAPIKNTCPDIEKVIKMIDDMVGDVKDYVHSLKYELENLRTANAILRGWGEELEDKNNELEKELEEFKN